MIAYELRHTIYVWEDCDTTVKTLLFETEDDAIEYLNVKKADLIDEYCKELNIPYSETKLREHLLSTSEETYNDYCDEDTYFRIEIEEYGYDILDIEKKEILRFN